MTPSRSSRSYSIQSNGSGPGSSSHKFKTQEFQPRVEEKMEDYQASTSSQRSEQLSTGRSGNIPVSVQELVYGSKAEGVGTSSQLKDMDNELLNGSEEALGPRKDT
ncbi:hypothetical protein O181_109073 [Austropuccinia psidii MF-1]|uniref:Uncharacterized protein n=1 Tax=Austropuccinia psidii MF-1 TaxID=1389203 RepID=A0A9Q3PPG7_9BASI|nr:hypothetical protein [Austropuccinia psidii MF-1]